MKKSTELEGLKTCYQFLRGSEWLTTLRNFYPCLCYILALYDWITRINITQQLLKMHRFLIFIGHFTQRQYYLIYSVPIMHLTYLKKNNMERSKRVSCLSTNCVVSWIKMNNDYYQNQIQSANFYDNSRNLIKVLPSTVHASQIRIARH